MLAAMRRASSLVSKVGCGAAALLKFKIDVRERVAVVVPHDEAAAVLDGPGRREAAEGAMLIQWRQRFFMAVRTGWSAEEIVDDENVYKSVACLACTQMHLVNLKTGKVLGVEEED